MSRWQRIKHGFKRFQTKVANSLDGNRVIYGLFGLTALSDARNMISWAFEFLHPGSAADEMHDWLLSPVGIVVATFESLFLVGFAVLGSYFSEKSTNNPFLRFLVLTWPYVRDSIKALKNGYKASRSLIYFGVIFGASALFMSHVLLPLGLILGASYLTSRMIYRHMCSERRKMQSTNDIIRKWNTLSQEEKEAALKANSHLKALIKKLVADGKITNETDTIPLTILLSLIQRHSTGPKVKGYLTSAFNGCLDGLYLYAGLYVLCSLVPVTAIIINTFAILFSIFSILKYIYEEYGFQRKLKVSAYKAKKQFIEALLEDKSLSEQEKLKYEEELQVVKAKLEKLDCYTYMDALGESLRSGLGVYSALTGILFAVNIFTPIPLIAILTVMGVGAAALLTFTCYNLIKTYIRNNHGKLKENKTPDNTEIVRAAASGIKQGAKQTNFVLNGLQEQNEQGHYQSSKVMLIVTWILSGILSIIYALKAWAKGFGRSEKEENLPPKPVSSDSLADASQILPNNGSTSGMLSQLNSSSSSSSIEEEQPPAPLEPPLKEEPPPENNAAPSKSRCLSPYIVANQAHKKPADVPSDFDEASCWINAQSTLITC